MLEGYYQTNDGVIHQKDYKIIKYDTKYINYYNTLGEVGMQMAYLRLGYLLGTLGFIPKKLLDIGYGNGDFLKAAKNIIPECYGSDISGYPVPEGIKFVKDITKDKYDVICFFDVLEHFEDISIIGELQTEYIYISLPWCHYDGNIMGDVYGTGEKWFKNWKHRKPGEHLHHFNKESLTIFLNSHNFEKVAISKVEDTIRKNPLQHHPNILSAIFKKV